MSNTVKLTKEVPIAIGEIKRYKGRFYMLCMLPQKSGFAACHSCAFFKGQERSCVVLGERIHCANYSVPGHLYPLLFWKRIR